MHDKLLQKSQICELVIIHYEFMYYVFIWMTLIVFEIVEYWKELIHLPESG